MPTLRDHSRLLIVVGLVILAGCAGGISGDQPAPEPGDADNTSQPPANGTVEVHYINVGQSVSTLIIGPDSDTMLVDTGHYNDDGEYVIEYLQRHDITRIDHLVTSHADADHIGGNAALIEYYETEADGIGAVYDPGVASSTQTYAEYLDAIEAHDVTLYETREGDTISFGDVDVDVLGPPDPYLENEDRNENSIVLKLTHGQTSFMLSGDAEDDQEAYLVDEYGSELSSTILKAGHHGSASSTSGSATGLGQVSLAETIDQTLTGTVPLLSEGELIKLEAVYEERCEGPCPDGRKPSDHQLSALFALLIALLNPYCDFAIFGPFHPGQVTA